MNIKVLPLIANDPSGTDHTNSIVINACYILKYDILFPLDGAYNKNQ